MKRIYFFVLMACLSSCIKETPTAFGDFNFINESTVNVKFIAYYGRYDSQDSFLVESGQTFKIWRSEDNSSQVSPFYCDTLLLIFNSMDSVIYYSNMNSSQNPLLLESYEAKKLGRRHYKYTYTITEEDYQNAMEANGIIPE